MVASRKGGGPEKEKARADAWAFGFLGEGGDQMAVFARNYGRPWFWEKLTQAPSLLRLAADLGGLFCSCSRQFLLQFFLLLTV